MPFASSLPAGARRPMYQPAMTPMRDDALVTDGPGGKSVATLRLATTSKATPVTMLPGSNAIRARACGALAAAFVCRDDDVTWSR